MRLTAEQYLEQLARRLGGAAGAGTARVYREPNAGDTPAIITRESFRYVSPDSDAGLDWLCQVLPSGYYDTARIAWTFDANPGSLLQPSYTALVFEGRYQSEAGFSPNGSFGLVETARSYNLLAHVPPITSPGIPVVLGGSLVIETVLTNTPLFLLLSMGNEQVVEEAVGGLAGVAVCVTLMTLRH